MEKEMKLNEQEMNELDLLNEFNVEELEKRYEMGWGPAGGGLFGMKGVIYF